MTELWKDIEGYEGHYQISNHGNVRSIKKNGLSIMKQSLAGAGYSTVMLRNKGNDKRLLVHRLVANAFIDGFDKAKEVNHINGIKTDNIVTNLECLSSSENKIHAHKIGLATKPANSGMQPKKVRANSLSKNEVLVFQSISEASRITGVCISGIIRACQGKYRQAGGYKWKYEEEGNEYAAEIAS